MGAVGMSVIGPKDWGKAIPALKVKLAISNTLKSSALAVQADFDVATQTWSDESKPDITIVPLNDYKVEVRVRGRIFMYVNEGTSAHAIVPRGRYLRFQRNYRAKTRPNGRIASYSGGKSGPMVFARRVWHPGTSGRHFDKIIRRKWDKQLPMQLRRAIRAAIR